MRLVLMTAARQATTEVLPALGLLGEVLAADLLDVAREVQVRQRGVGRRDSTLVYAAGYGVSCTGSAISVSPSTSFMVKRVGQPSSS